MHKWLEITIDDESKLSDAFIDYIELERFAFNTQRSYWTHPIM